MLRAMVSGLAALALGACAYGSAVDIAPMSARPSKPLLASGVYCEVKGETAPFTVVSSNDCVPLHWDKPGRTYTIIDRDDGEKVVAAIVPIGSAVHAAQITVEDGPAPYQITLLLAKGEAFAMLPVLDGEELKAVAARHGRVRFKGDKDGRPYVASGQVRDIKTFLLDAARQSLRDMKPEEDTLSVGVRDVDGAADHPASRSQTRDIEALLKTAARLAK